MLGKPQWCVENCKYAAIGGGFCPDLSRLPSLSGFPSRKPKVLLCGEAPGQREILEGYPFAGKAGWKLDEILAKAGGTRDDVAIMNVLRCRPPENKYPIHPQRNWAETACRHWDAGFHEFAPDIIGVTFHPAFLLREPIAETLLVSDMEMAFRWAGLGKRPMLCLGRQAMGVFLPHLSGEVKRWRGHWENYDPHRP